MANKTLRTINKKKIENFRFNENVCFFSSASLNRSLKETLFTSLPENENCIYCRFINDSFDDDITCSFVAFKKDSKPSCFEEDEDGWNETKMAYLLLIEYRGYVAINKKNITLTKEIKTQLEKISYTTISNFLLSDASSVAFTKMAMKNLDMSEFAMRSKILESDDLEKSFSPYNSNLYAVSSFRTNIKRDAESSNTYSVALSNSRINKFGEKQKYEDLVKWMVKCIDDIVAYENNSLNAELPSEKNILSYFAKPVENTGDLECESILITKNDIMNLIDEKESVKIYYYKDENEIELDREPFINDWFTLYDNFDEDNYVKKCDDGFLIYIKKMDETYIKIDDETSQSLLEFINDHQSYVLSFKNSLLKYSYGTFFDTSTLISSIPYFKKLFQGHKLLNNAESEKGHFDKGQTSFDEKSVFGATEKIFKEQYKYFICDDLGTEYADHIGIVETGKNDSEIPAVTFFIEKGSDRLFSASAFQEVVAQAQKNIGNFILNPNQQERLKDKYGSKKGKYRNDKIKTKINRMRKGDCNDAVDKWLEISKYPFLKKKLFLVVNFITPSQIEDVFNRFESMDKSSNSQENYSEAKQMLWLIASLHNFCIEHNVELKIICPFKRSFPQKTVAKK